MTPTHLVALLACLLPATAMAGSAPVQRDGAGPYFKLSLPQALHSSAQDPQLGDLRVLDAQGQALPWAWAPEPNPEASSNHQAVRLFPVPKPASPGAPLPPSITLHPDGSVQWKGGGPAATSGPGAADTWLVDTHHIRGNLMTLTLRWPDSAQGVFPMKLEASDDLRHWRPLDGNAAVLKLQQAGQVLSQDSIPLDGVRARYLRLQWLGTSIALQSAEVEHLLEPIAPPPALQWTAAWAPSQCDSTGCTWTLPPHLPLDAVRLELAQANTVANVHLWGESSVSLTPLARQHHHPLHGLRHRREAVANSTGTQRQLLWDGVVWRLSLPDHSESRQAMLTLDGGHYDRLRLEARQSTREWGAVPPTLNLGTRSRDIIFLAREPGPIQLAWGDSKAPGLPMPVSQLMPLGERSPVSAARVTLPELQRPSAEALGVSAAPSAAAEPARDSTHTPWLWAALVGGLLLLGGMAYSLLKGLKTPP